MKNKLKKPHRLVIGLDLDGTLCHGEFWGDDEPEPYRERIEYFNNLYREGAIILINTARTPDYARATQAWLCKHGVMYHGINYQHKCGADLYIDDKSVNIIDINIK